MIAERPRRNTTLRSKELWRWSSTQCARCGWIASIAWPWTVRGRRIYCCPSCAYPRLYAPS